MKRTFGKDEHGKDTVTIDGHTASLPAGWKRLESRVAADGKFTLLAGFELDDVGQEVLVIEPPAPNVPDSTPVPPQEVLNASRARELGFEDAEELISLAAAVPLFPDGRPDHKAMAKFKDWKKRDGTKSGLLERFPTLHSGGKP